MMVLHVGAFKMNPAGGDDTAAAARIFSVYLQHDPSELKAVPLMLEVFAGRWDQLYWNICRKYGVNPDESSFQ